MPGDGNARVGIEFVFENFEQVLDRITQVYDRIAQGGRAAGTTGNPLLSGAPMVQGDIQLQGREPLGTGGYPSAMAQGYSPAPAGSGYGGVQTIQIDRVQSIHIQAATEVHIHGGMAGAAASGGGGGYSGPLDFGPGYSIRDDVGSDFARWQGLYGSSGTAPSTVPPPPSSGPRYRKGRFGTPFADLEDAQSAYDAAAASGTGVEDAQYRLLRATEAAEAARARITGGAMSGIGPNIPGAFGGLMRFGLAGFALGELANFGASTIGLQQQLQYSGGDVRPESFQRQFISSLPLLGGLLGAVINPSLSKSEQVQGVLDSQTFMQVAGAPGSWGDYQRRAGYLMNQSPAALQAMQALAVQGLTLPEDFMQRFSLARENTSAFGVGTNIGIAPGYVPPELRVPILSAYSRARTSELGMATYGYRPETVAPGASAARQMAGIALAQDDFDTAQLLMAYDTGQFRAPAPPRPVLQSRGRQRPLYQEWDEWEPGQPVPGEDAHPGSMVGGSGGGSGGLFSMGDAGDPASYTGGSPARPGGMTAPRRVRRRRFLGYQSDPDVYTMVTPDYAGPYMDNELTRERAAQEAIRLNRYLLGTGTTRAEVAASRSGLLRRTGYSGAAADELGEVGAEYGAGLENMGFETSYVADHLSRARANEAAGVPGATAERIGWERRQALLNRQALSLRNAQVNAQIEAADIRFGDPQAEAQTAASRFQTRVGLQEQYGVGASTRMETGLESVARLQGAAGSAGQLYQAQVANGLTGLPLEQYRLRAEQAQAQAAAGATGLANMPLDLGTQSGLSFAQYQIGVLSSMPGAYGNLRGALFQQVGLLGDAASQVQGMMAQQQAAGALTPAAALQYQERLQQLGVQQASAYQQLSYGWENRLMSTMIGSPGSFNLNGRGFALRDAVLFGGAVNPHFGSNRSNLPFFLQLAGLGNLPSRFPGVQGPFDAPGFGVYGLPGMPGSGGAPVGASGGSGGYGAGGTGPAPDMPGGLPASGGDAGGGPGSGAGGNAGAYGGLPTGGPAPVGATGGGGGYGPGGAAPAPDMPGGAGSGPAPFNPFAPMLPGESTDDYVRRRDAGFGVTSPSAGHDLGHPTRQIDWTRKGRADAWWNDAIRRSWAQAHPPQVPKSQDPGSPDHGGGDKGVQKFEITIKLVGPNGQPLGEGTVTGKPGGTSSTNLGVNGDLWSLLNGMGVGTPTTQ